MSALSSSTRQFRVVEVGTTSSRSSPVHESFAMFSSSSASCGDSLNSTLGHGKATEVLRSAFDTIAPIRPSNDADLPVSLEHRQGDVAHVPDIPVQPEVFQQVMFAQAVAPRERFVELPSRTMTSLRPLMRRPNA